MSWREKARLQGWRLWAVVAVLAYTLLGFLFLPWLARNQAPKLAQEHLGVDLAIEKVRFNPYLFKLTVEGLDLEDPVSGPMLAFRRLVVDFSLSSTWRRAWTFGELTLEQPMVRLHRGEDGIGNLERVLDRLPPPAEPTEPAPEGDLPRLVLHNVSLVEGRLRVEDDAHPEDWSLALGPLSFQMADFATLPEREGIYRLEATGPRGGVIRWSGSFAVGPLQSAGSVEVERLALAPFWEYARHEYDAELTGDARLGLSFDYDLDAAGGQTAFELRAGRAELTGLDVARASTGDALLGLPRVAAAGVEFDLASSLLRVAAVDVTEPRVDVRRLEDGRLDLVAALAPAGDEPQPEPEEPAGADAGTEANANADAPANAAALAIELDALRLDGGRVAFEDRAAPAPVRLELQDLGLVVNNYRSADGHRAEVELNAAAASGGNLSVAGTVRGAPLDVGLDVSVADLSLLPALPYAAEAMNLEITSLQAAAAGRVTLTGEEPLGYTGTASLRGLASNLPGKDEQLIGWQAVDAEGIELSLAQRNLRIGKVVATEPFLRVLVSEAGELNLAAIVPAADDAEAAAPADAPATPAGDDASTEPFTVGVGRVDVRQATMDFTDLNLPLPFRALVKPMDGQVSAITTGSPTPARIELDGDVNEYGAATVRGALDLVDPKRVMDLELDFRNIEMEGLTPYTVKFAGREIAAGRLDVDLSWSIRNGQLESVNRMVINDLQLGAEVDSPGAMSLPLDLAVALLTDTEGRIDLEVPVSGDLNDPQFRYAPLVFKAIGNVLAKIVTAPFRFLGALLGGDADAEALEFVGFVAGDAELRGPEAEDLGQLATALAQRPELALQVGAAYDEERDGRAIRERRLDDAISARFEAGAAKGKDGDPVRLIMEAMYTEAAGPDAVAGLQATHTSTPEGSDKPVLDETTYLEALRAELLAQQAVDPQELRLLGLERAAAVQNYLVESGGVDAARVSVAEPAAAPKADDNLVFLQLELGVGG